MCPSHYDLCDEEISIAHQFWERESRFCMWERGCGFLEKAQVGTAYPKKGEDQTGPWPPKSVGNFSVASMEAKENHRLRGRESAEIRGSVRRGSYSSGRGGS